MKNFKPKHFVLSAAAIILAACQPLQTVEVRPVSNPQLESLGQETQDYYKVGKSYLATSDYGLAINAFRKSLQMDSTSIASLNGLAIAYDMLSRFDISQKYYQKALDLDPQSPMTLSNLSYSLHAQGEHDDALQIAHMVEKIVAGNKDDDKEIAPVVAANISIAENSAQLEAETSPQKDEYYTAIERTSVRDWEVVQKKVLPPKKPLIHKASFSVNDIIERVYTKNVEKVEKVEKMEIQKEQLHRHTYRILNGTGRPQMAQRMKAFLNDSGVTVWAYANAQRFNYKTSVINFMPGHREEAEKILKSLPVPIEIKEVSDLRSDVELILGQDLLSFDSSLHKDHYDI